VTQLRVLLFAAIFAIGIAVVQTQAAPSVSAAPNPSQAGAVITFAKRQIDKPYRLGANGLQRYDCSGLVWRAFREAGLAERIGGQRTSRGYYNYFKKHGKVTSQPHKGDLVVWARKGKRVSHIGIFDGYNRRGKAMAISALVNPYGVTRHKVRSINIPFKAYLHVNLDR
jgi:cell wall-associated NlpC family hydrolase